MFNKWKVIFGVNSDNFSMALQTNSYVRFTLYYNLAQSHVITCYVYLFYIWLQSCYLEQYISTIGAVRYNLGCKDTLVSCHKI